MPPQASVGLIMGRGHQRSLGAGERAQGVLLSPTRPFNGLSSCPQTCPRSKDPVWSQVFSFFVGNVASEQLHLKVCWQLGCWVRAKRCLSQGGGSSKCTSSRFPGHSQPRLSLPQRVWSDPVRERQAPHLREAGAQGHSLGKRWWAHPSGPLALPVNIFLVVTAPRVARVKSTQDITMCLFFYFKMLIFTKDLCKSQWRLKQRLV